MQECDPVTQKDEEGRSQVQGQLELQTQLKATLGNLLRCQNLEVKNRAEVSAQW